MYGETTYFKDPTVTTPQGGDQMYSVYQKGWYVN
jgi:hypothetical protein